MPITDHLVNEQYIGLSLTSANSSKNSLTILEKSPENIFILTHCNDLGTLQDVHSDDRILCILEHQSNIRRISINAPLTEPPCMSCSLETCPGIVSCPNPDVAYMQLLNTEYKKRGIKRRRSFNPQQHRIADIERGLHSEHSTFQPAYSSHLQSLATRAKVLSKRLATNSSLPKLREGNVLETLKSWNIGSDCKPEQYKCFTEGLRTRTQVLENTIKPSLQIDVECDQENYKALSLSSFESLILAIQSFEATFQCSISDPAFRNGITIRNHNESIPATLNFGIKTRGV